MSHVHVLYGIYLLFPSEQPEDVDRTVNIHTDYIEFLDFDMCTEDKEFLVQVSTIHSTRDTEAVMLSGIKSEKSEYLIIAL